MAALSGVPVEVVLLPERCYRCHMPTAAVAGLWFAHGDVAGDAYEMTEEPGGWFLAYDDTSAAVVAEACPDELLTAHGAGPLRWRTTRVRPDGYLANTCINCGTVLGNWPLHEALIEHRAEGGSMEQLPRIQSALEESALERM